MNSCMTHDETFYFREDNYLKLPLEKKLNNVELYSTPNHKAFWPFQIHRITE